jgi:hypothetical protein
MKTRKRKNAGQVRLVNFSPGAALVKFLYQYAARNMLETQQESLRVLIRDRVNQEKATP